MNRLVSRLLDDHYWTTRWVAVGTFAFFLSLWLGGPR